MVTIGF
jgi:hypothetical protein